jgi:hypothetical protein
LKVWDEIYLYETNALAAILYSGAEFIQALPGPADNAVGSNVYLNATYR